VILTERISWIKALNLGCLRREMGGSDLGFKSDANVESDGIYKCRPNIGTGRDPSTVII